MATAEQIAAISFDRLACLTLAPQSIAMLVARGFVVSTPVGVPSHLRLPGVLCHLHENSGLYEQLDGASYVSALRDPVEPSRQITSLEAYLLLKASFEENRTAFLDSHYTTEQIDQIVAALPSTTTEDEPEPLVVTAWSATLEETPNIVPAVPLAWQSEAFTVTDETLATDDGFSITRAGISSTNDFYRGCLIFFHRDDEPFYCEWAQIVSYDGSTKRASLDRPLSGVPSAGVRCLLSSRPEAIKESLDDKSAGCKVVIISNVFNALPVVIDGTPSRAVLDYQFEVPGLGLDRPAGGTTMDWWDANFPSMVERFFAALAELGAEVDAINSDLEVFRFPRSESLDFDALRNQADADEIEDAVGWSLDDLELFAGSGWYTTQRHKQLRWSAWQMRTHAERFQSLYETAIVPHYPDAKLTDYDGLLTAAGVYGSRQSYSWAVPLGPKPAISGINSFRSYAGLTTKLWDWSLAGGEGNFVPPPFGQDWTGSPAVPIAANSHPRAGWTSFLHDRITVRAMRAASNLPTWLRVAFRQQVDTPFATHPDLWFECIFHNALEVDRLLYYTPADGSGEDIHMQRALDELNQLIGFRERVPLSFDRVSYASTYVASCCDAGGRYVWRITPDPEMEWHTQALPGGSLLIQIGDTPLELSSAQVWEAANPLSSLGVWVLQFAESPVEEPPIDDASDDIAVIKRQALAMIRQLTTKPKPNYTIDGQRVDWATYMKQLQDTVAWCNEQLANEEPFEINSYIR